ncbi:DUF4249 domain-containing protein [Telluribacter sp. SYSU D00476]|uniref:DUF4249 domain-containing protein n=1 Tax=Telluribacter sp. SYSU D00476 TaxID=2811430 RepID=UPI001FF2E431|nr:DUF4249 domain-containing protein [Telluribacter sp. SYSU D00476]
MSLGLSKKSLFLLLGTVAVLSSCVSEVDIPYPVTEQEYVLNGILNPDSTIRISLHKTLPPLSADKTYPAVEEATVVCYEDGQRLGELIYKGMGHYELPQTYPTPGRAYKIEAHIGDRTLTASDTVPQPAAFTLKKVKTRGKNPNNNPDLYLTLSEGSSKESVTWLSISGIEYYSAGYQAPRVLRSRNYLPLSVSAYLDDFNASRESDYNLKSYSPLARVKPGFGRDVEVVFTVFNSISALNEPGEKLDLHVLQASRSYDRYIKSAIVAMENRLVDEDGGLNNPFYEPSNTYSNITNGLGFFGAVLDQKRAIVEEVKF